MVRASAKGEYSAAEIAHLALSLPPEPPFADRETRGMQPRRKVGDGGRVGVGVGGGTGGGGGGVGGG